VRGPLKEYRNNLIHGSGLSAGVRADGGLFLGDGPGATTAPARLDAEAVELRLIAEPDGADYRVELSAYDLEGGRRLGRVERADVPAGALVGNLALAANFGAPPGGGARRDATKARPTPAAGRWWFADWEIAGTKVEAREDRAFGPILFNQYTLHGGTLKMTAQMPPLGADDEPAVRLQVRRGEAWRTSARSGSIRWRGRRPSASNGGTTASRPRIG
jgi:hypothetical protein